MDELEIQRSWYSVSMRRRLVAFARRFVGDHQEAEDVAQEALFRAGDGASSLRSESKAEAWLFRICRHAAIDHVRARRVRRGVWGVMPDDPGEGGGSRGHEVQDGLVSGRPGAVSLRRLPAHQRLLLELHYGQGMAQAALCRRSGLSPSALRVRLYRARRALASLDSCSDPSLDPSRKNGALADRGGLPPRRAPSRFPAIQTPSVPPHDTSRGPSI
jgi:RNA polymerase sigma-70 factor (ECF subfamily)